MDELLDEDECPSCDGRCVDKRGQTCRTCHGEGYILTLPTARSKLTSN